MTRFIPALLTIAALAVVVLAGAAPIQSW